MLGNLKNPPEPFADIIRTHFRLKAKAISAQLNRWLTQDDGKSIVGDGAAGFNGSGKGASSSSEMLKDVEELKRLMKKLQAGDDID